MAFCSDLCLSFTYLAFYLGVAVYAFFGVLFLIADARVCENFNPIWICSLFTLLVNMSCFIGLNIWNSNIADKKDEYVLSETQKQCIIGILVIGSLFIYQSVVFYSKNDLICPHLLGTGIYRWLEVNWWLNLFSLMVFVILSIFIPIFLLPSDSKSTAPMSNASHRLESEPLIVS